MEESDKVVVGVIDNGFDYFDPNLKGQVEPGYYYSGGYHPEVYANLAHGTLVASLIVAPGCRTCCRQAEHRQPGSS